MIAQLYEQWCRHRDAASALVTAEESGRDEAVALCEAGIIEHVAMADIEDRMRAEPATDLRGVAAKLSVALSLAAVMIGADNFDTAFGLVSSASADLAELIAKLPLAALAAA